MAKKASNRRSTPELDLGASTIPTKQKKAAEATESAIAGISAFNVDKSEAVVQPPDPNAIMFDEYGIDGSTYDIPIILKAILCELVRRRV
jgi:hypothetical protein